MSVLDAAKIGVRRGARAVLDDVSLHAESGDFVAVIGANGAGKSTLLSVWAGLLRPDSGGVMLDGVPIRELSGMQLAHRRAYLPQNPRGEWPISVERLVALGLTPTLPALGGLPASFHPQITRALQACDLLDHREQPATGQVQGQPVAVQHDGKHGHRRSQQRGRREQELPHPGADADVVGHQQV